MLQPDDDPLPPHDGRSRQNHGRAYDIKSLDVGTFENSQNFLARYRLWALIDTIIVKDPHKTPVENRTIDWLVDNYLRHFRKRDIHHRIISDPARDSDVDDEGNTVRKRHVRHVPRSEIIGLFAAHAEWILAQHLASTSSAVRKLDIPSWISFCKEVKFARKAAENEGTRWGLAYGVKSAEDVGEDSDIDLLPFGETREFWNKKIKAATAQKKPKSKPV
jgi:hypothetical protein